MILLAMNYYFERKNTKYFRFRIWFIVIFLYKAFLLKEINIIQKWPWQNGSLNSIIQWKEILFCDWQIKIASALTENPKIIKLPHQKQKQKSFNMYYKCFIQDDCIYLVWYLTVIYIDELTTPWHYLLF